MYPPMNDNDLSQMRLRSLLDSGVPTVSAFSPRMTPDQSQQNDSIAATDTSKMSPLMQKFEQLVQKMPQRQEPSFGRRVLAGLSSLSAKDPMEAQQTIDKVKYGDYDNQMSDWNNQVKALHEAASEEDKQAINQRLLTLGLGNQALKGRDLDIKAARANAYALDKANPNWNHAVIGGKLVLWNPKDPTQSLDTQYAPTPEELEELKQKGRIDLENIRSQTSKDVAEIGAKGRTDAAVAGAAARGDQQRQTNAAKTTNETPQQRSVRLFSRAQQAINQHPEWAKYILLNPPVNGSPMKGQFQIVAPKAGWLSKEDPNAVNTMHDINQYIYGFNQQSNSQPSVSKRSDGKYIGTDKNGQQFIINEADVDSFKKSNGIQ